MGILEFPSELFLLVAENLSIRELSKFRSTSRRLRFALTPRYEKLCLEDIGKLTALQWAAVRGHAELIELAISKKAEIDKPLGSKLHTTAPHMSDRPRFVCLLANRIACLNRAKDAIARTPLYLAACSGKVVATKVLLKLGASMQCFGEVDTPAHISARRGDVGCMRAFIRAKFDITTRGRKGSTILHEAIVGGVEMVSYLLGHAGAEKLVNTKDSYQRTPLHLVVHSYAVTDKRKVMAELLLQHGADINARDSHGNTPAYIEARRGEVKIMRVLMGAGRGFHARGYGGQTILHRALENRNGVLEYLLGEEGGRRIINVRDNHGDSPLDYAVAFKDREVVRRLVKCGAKYNARTNTKARKRREFRPLFDVV